MPRRASPLARQSSPSGLETSGGLDPGAHPAKRFPSFPARVMAALVQPGSPSSVGRSAHGRGPSPYPTGRNGCGLEPKGEPHHEQQAAPRKKAHPRRLPHPGRRKERLLDQIGAAWIHDDGEGLNLSLEFISTDNTGRLVIRANKADTQARGRPPNEPDQVLHRRDACLGGLAHHGGCRLGRQSQSHDKTQKLQCHPLRADGRLVASIEVNFICPARPGSWLGHLWL